MSRHRSQSFRKPQLPLQGKEKEKYKERGREKEERQGSVTGLAQGVVYEPLIFRSLLSSRWRFSSTLGLKLTSTDDSQRPPSPPKARSPKERHDPVSPQAQTQGQGQGQGHGLKRRASASAFTAPMVRPAIPHRTSSKGHIEHREDSSATAVPVDAKRTATPDPSSPRRHRRRDSATSSRPLSPTIEAKDISADNASKPAKPSIARRRSSQGQGQVKPELKPTTATKHPSEDVLHTASNKSEISLRSSLKKDKPTPDPPPSSIPENVIESNRPESTEPPAKADPSPEPQPPPSPSEPPSPPKPPPKPHHPPTRTPTTSPKPEHLAILGPLANFIPVPKPLPPPRPPSPPLPPTILPLSKSPKNASRVRFGDTTIYSVSPTGRHLHPIGPKQFKTRSGLSYLNPPADPLTAKRNRRTVVEWKGVGGAKMRRHRERQAAMARYWLRTEEEERAGREEKRRRAEGVVRRYAEEPGKGPDGAGGEEEEGRGEEERKEKGERRKEGKDKGDEDGTNGGTKDGLETKAHGELSTFLIVVMDRAPTSEEITEDKEHKMKEAEKKEAGTREVGKQESQNAGTQEAGKQGAEQQLAGKQATEKQDAGKHATGKQDIEKRDARQDIPLKKKEVGIVAAIGVFEATTGTGKCSGKQSANVGEQSSKDSPVLTGTGS